MEGPFKQFFFKIKYKECFIIISWCWSHTLSILLEGVTALKLQVYSQNKKIKCVEPMTTIILPKINLEHLELLRPVGPQIQLPGGPKFT